MTAVTEDKPRQEPQDLETETVVETDWTPVSAWGTEAQEIIEDIRAIREVQALLRTGPSLATQPEYGPATEILDTALNGRRIELARIIMKLHRGEPVERPVRQVGSNGMATSKP